MPSKLRRERERAKAEIREQTERALADAKQSQVFGVLMPEQLSLTNEELAAGAGRYCIRGVKFDEFGNVIPPKNWGKNDTWHQNRTAADYRCRLLRKAAGDRWGKSHNIRWIIGLGDNLGFGSLCAKTIRNYFRRMP